MASLDTLTGTDGKQWLHSFEEDTAQETVYRPSDWAFPPARRGRSGFTLKPNGALIERTIGPGDQGVPSSPGGTWSIGEAASESETAPFPLLLHPAGGTPSQTLNIVQLSPDRLVVRKSS